MKNKTHKIKPGGVSKYIAQCPKEIQSNLSKIRKAICEVAPNAIETMSYFDMPSYSYEGYDYNGMFAWFSFKSPFIRLHVRPNALVKCKSEIKKYNQTKAIVSFPMAEQIPRAIVKKLVKASIADMKKNKRI